MRETDIVFDFVGNTFYQTTVHGHKINAIQCMLTNNANKFFFGDIFQFLFQIAYRIIHGYRANHGGTHGNQLFTEFTGFAVVAQVHNGFCFHVDGGADLFHFFF